MKGGIAGLPQNHKTPLPLPTAEDLAWERDAACRDQEPDLFYPERGGHGGRDDAEKAIMVCQGCPLHAVIGCAKKARVSSNSHGVWAGVYYGNGSRQKAAARTRIERIAARDLSEAI